MDFFTIILLIAGINCVLGGLVWCYFTFQLSMRCLRLPGTVIELKQDKSNMFHPLVSYEPEPCKVQQFVGKVGSYPASHTVGQALTVMHDPKQPMQPHIGSLTSMWLFPLALTFTGLFLLLIALF